MFRRDIFSAAVVVALLAATAAVAAEKFTLKISPPSKVGDRSKVTKTEKMRTENELADDSGKVIETQKKTHDLSATYVETVLALDGNHVTKSARKYEKATKTLDGKAQNLELDGKTVVCEKVGKKYRFSLEGGGELSDPALDLLNEEFKDKHDNDEIEKLFMPDGPVAIDDAWKLKVKEIVKQLFPEIASETVDMDKAKGAGKLRKVYDKDGHKFGVIEIAVDLPIVKFGEAGDMIKADAGSIMNIKLTLDVCIDGAYSAGSMTVKVNAKILGTLDVGGQKATVKAIATVDAVETQTPLK